MGKILLVANFIDKPGGTGRQETYMIKALSSMSLSVIVPSEPHRSNASLMNQSKVKIYALTHKDEESKEIFSKNFKLPFVEVLKQRTIKKIIEKEKPHVIISSGGMPRYIINKAHEVGAKTIVYYHMITPWYVETRGFYRKYMWSDLSMLWFSFSTALGKLTSIDFDSWPYVDRVIVNSNYMAFLARRYWKKEPYVLQPPIELKNFVVYPREKRTLEIVSVGRLDPDKHYEDLIEVIRKKYALREKVKIRLIGFAGNVKYLLNLLKLAAVLHDFLMCAFMTRHFSGTSLRSTP